MVIFAILSQEIVEIRQKGLKIGKIGPMTKIPNKNSKNDPQNIPSLPQNIQPKLGPRRLIKSPKIDSETLSGKHPFQNSQSKFSKIRKLKQEPKIPERFSRNIEQFRLNFHSILSRFDYKTKI